MPAGKLPPYQFPVVYYHQKTFTKPHQHPVSTLDCPALVIRVPSSVNCIRFAEAVRAVQQRNRRSRKSWSLSEWTYMSVCACMHACTNRGLPILPLCSNLWASRSKAAQWLAKKVKQMALWLSVLFTLGRTMEVLWTKFFFPYLWHWSRGIAAWIAHIGDKFRGVLSSQSGLGYYEHYLYHQLIS